MIPVQLLHTALLVNSTTTHISTYNLESLDSGNDESFPKSLEKHSHHQPRGWCYWFEGYLRNARPSVPGFDLSPEPGSDYLHLPSSAERTHQGLTLQKERLLYKNAYLICNTALEHFLCLEETSYCIQYKVYYSLYKYCTVYFVLCLNSKVIFMILLVMQTFYCRRYNDPK